jgi:hypothetical protein
MVSEKTVQWPAKALNAEGDDLGAPVRELADRLGLLKAPQADPGSAAGVIESTTLEITNQVKHLITMGGGATVVVGALGSGWAAVEDNTPLAVTLAGGAAVVLASVILALSQVMNGDVRGRAAATTEQLRSRGVVATAFVQAAAGQLGRARSSGGAGQAAESNNQIAGELQMAFAFGKPVLVTTTDDGQGVVKELKWTANQGIRLTLDNGDQISLSESQGVCCEVIAITR